MIIILDIIHCLYIGFQKLDVLGSHAPNLMGTLYKNSWESCIRRGKGEVLPVLN
jgi:hypothetical protein